MKDADVTAHPNWAEGVVTLISTDNLSFKVQSEILFSEQVSCIVLSWPTHGRAHCCTPA